MLKCVKLTGLQNWPWPVLLGVLVCFSPAAWAADEREEFFETHVRPVLADHCVSCHGPDDQSGGLRLDSQAAMLKGGKHGPVIAADSASSPLLLAVRRSGELKMPPEDPLSAPQIEALQKWLEHGAYWPPTLDVIRTAPLPEAMDHWAFQPVQEPAVPEVSGDWAKTPLDSFVLTKLQHAGLVPSPETDRRSLIRRVTYTLTGLPPTAAEVDQFMHDSDPQAYEKLIDRLLDSPQYGEHWARHWLDVARYSDTKGYVYAREERFWVHAWVYRDWVVQALNEDMPYDRFVLLQLAADQVEDRRQSDLAAIGFLTLGRRFLGVERDIIDDRIDVVCRGLMALTAGCARCHDHKYDPIPTTDYYSLYGVFDSCREELVRLGQPGSNAEFDAELAKRETTLEEALVAARQEWSDRIRSRAGDYLFAQTEPQKYPPKGFDQIFEKGDMLPAFVHRWEEYLRHAAIRHDPVFIPWQAYFAIRGEDFAPQALEVTQQLGQRAEEINPLVLQLFSESPESIAQVALRYGELFGRIDAQWKEHVAASGSESPPSGLPDASAEQLRQVLYGPDAPCEVPRESVVHIESHVDSGSCNNLWKLQGEVDRWIIRSVGNEPFTIILVDRPTPARPRVFKRGNPANKGDEVPRHFLSLLSSQTPFEHGSGRRELANAIVDPANPLTARVIVNRVWANHFGTGLVPTTSDFGMRADDPSHPDLLDWLASQFVNGGWSIKDLHRTILRSATYRQSSLGPDDPNMLIRAGQVDPDNRLLWRMNSHRLAFEELRDSLLSAGGSLDAITGGKPTDLFASPYPHRRTLYGLVDRQFFASTLRVFDFANPDLHIPQRPETTVPQQALFFLNHPLVLQSAGELARAAQAEPTTQAKVSFLYRAAYQREATPGQLRTAVGFLESAEVPEAAVERPTAAQWSYGYGRYDEASHQVADWKPLPHFTGTAWQGAEQWPNPALGWTQLTATGGHPGNDRNHACVRRWTAPSDLTIRIESHLMHEPEPGDGIRAFIVRSSGGLLDTASIHHQNHDFISEPIRVAAGDTLDFVVDINEVLNSDQFLWNIQVSSESADGEATTWDSEADFTPNTTSQLSPLEQLAHVLLSSNEFLFVD